MYRSLSPTQIRLLRLFPSVDEDAPLQTELFSFSFLEAGKDVHPYHALSYVWGGNDKPRFMLISGHEMSITENLYWALIRLRHPLMERTLWIDAICINQGDDREKERQIRIMAYIYAQASCVIVWLGKEGDNSDRALEEIRAAGDPALRDNMGSPNTPNAIRALLERSWFQRIWVRIVLDRLTKIQVL